MGDIGQCGEDRAFNGRVTVEMSPIQWAGLKGIHEVKPLNETDYACLAEVRTVLAKYGRRERFGVALLHSHFKMESAEILVECSDPKRRVLTIKPAKKETVGDTIETIWMFRDDDGDQMLECQQHCAMSGHPES
ncbi:MAG: hypothetical protein AB7I48_24740 [Planctomycetaceae bacterium]